MLEVLVAALLFSIGIAGVIGLQLYIISGSQIASNRTKALVLIEDIAERIRSNPVAGVAGSYKYSSSNPVGTCDKNCDQEQCSPSDLAKFDLYSWEKMMSTVLALPSASGTIEHGSVDGSYTVTVRWQDLERQSVENKEIKQKFFLFSDEEIEFLTP
jgi:type IV pilus assembly protein PilV